MKHLTFNKRLRNFVRAFIFKTIVIMSLFLFTNEGIDNIQVIDRTTNVIADSGGFYFRVLDKNTGIAYSLGEYLKTIKDEVERNQKNTKIHISCKY